MTARFVFVICRNVLGYSTHLNGHGSKTPESGSSPRPTPPPQNTRARAPPTLVSPPCAARKMAPPRRVSSHRSPSSRKLSCIARFRPDYYLGHGNNQPFSSARLEEVGWLSGVGGLRSGGWCVQSSRTHAPGQSRVLGRGLGYEQQVRGWGHCEAFLGRLLRGRGRPGLAGGGRRCISGVSRGPFVGPEDRDSEVGPRG